MGSKLIFFYEMIVDVLNVAFLGRLVFLTGRCWNLLLNFFRLIIVGLYSIFHLICLVWII